MPMLAAVHLVPMITVPMAAVVAIVVIWYWLALGRAVVPRSQRRIRRTSLSIILVTIPVIVGAVSIVDPNERASAYVVLWSVGVLCLLLVLMTAVADVLNNMRLHREAAHDRALAATVQIMKGMKGLANQENHQANGCDNAETSDRDSQSTTPNNKANIG